jgi:hypothetical protein
MSSLIFGITRVVNEDVKLTAGDVGVLTFLEARAELRQACPLGRKLRIYLSYEADSAEELGATPIESNVGDDQFKGWK